MSALDTSEAMMREVMAHLRKTGARWRSDAVRDVIAERDRLRAVNAELLAALQDAVDCVEHWGAYAGEFFQQKHDLAGDVTRLRAAIARATGGKP